VTDTPKPTTSTSSSTPPTPKVTQYVAASVDDDRLEPDAMRGSEQFLKDAGTENLEQVRIEKLQADQKKSA